MTSSGIQNSKPEIIIVGAGPAGTSLAIRLANKGLRTTLVEREKFPRHKLCGEFISPECLEHFRELGVLDEMLIRGGDRISQTIFYAENGQHVVVPSEWFGGSRKGALGLSRAEMDFRLLEKARESGVRILEESQVVGLLFKGEEVCGVKTKNGQGEIIEIRSDLTIDATGRAKVLSRLAEKRETRGRGGDAGTRRRGERERGREGEKERELKGRFSGLKEKLTSLSTQYPVLSTRNLVGFKTHLKNVRLPKGRCEIYFFRGGYGGLSYVEDGVANHCFLIKADVVKEFKGDAGKILNEVIFQNKRARKMMRGSETVFDWLAVSVDGFGVKKLNPAKNLISVGDAAAFIDPFTGSGMLMALESARLLSEVIGNENVLPKDIAGEYEILHRRKFRKRLRICSVMRRLSFVPKFARLAIFILSLSEKPREILARSTRQTKFD